MTQYFKQFGMVTNVRVIRSKRTGNSKGFAFVEFKEPAVAEIVAETMNNYLMGKRLIKGNLSTYPIVMLLVNFFLGCDSAACMQQFQHVTNLGTSKIKLLCTNFETCVGLSMGNEIFFYYFEFIAMRNALI